ncbi:putative L-aspartate dehydrogenase [Pusillimonas sp. T7-7]|uniref:aspartate dehydrogenase n=1 Tax=Pusillimonas sp. (strain T7-7) TaxID=1007105 RepID=UPI0002084D0D|nr:aspartate dehydrogenase [Pusillimonas sp. T7-7]AEC21745.1 putative L-aspartate dehydrogenase [Pusillimonas sp. T7-7]
MEDIRVGVAGFGAIGRSIAQHLAQGIEGLQLAAVGVRNPDAPPKFDWAGQEPPRFALLDDLEQYCDIVVECAPAALLARIASPFLSAGKKVISLSSGALLAHPELVDLARAHGGQILVPSGAILGLDAILGAAEGNIKSVKMVSRKPVKGFVGAPFLVERNIDVLSLKEPMLIFSGTAREAAAGFPANLNVAVSVSLAGVGPDKTLLEVWADPTLERNTHHVQVVSDSALLSMEIQNIPSDNPKTGRITAQSVIAMLRKLRAPLSVGT